MTNEIVQAGSAAIMPVLSIGEAVARYNALVEFTKQVMKKDKDYGVIPGTGDKPTLLKPGAEKLCSLFGFVPEFEIVDRIVDFEKGLFYYHYACKLSRGGQLVATGEGSANSREKKYRWRNIPESKATDEDKASAIRVETRTGKYGKYKVYVVENSEPFDLINTLQKMGQKRSLVAATLIAANASEFFTQDVEDMKIIEGEFTDVTHESGHNEPAPTKKAKASRPTPNADRPYPPEAVEAMPEPEAPPANGKKVDPKVGALIDAGIAENVPNAAKILTLIKAGGLKTVEEVVARGRLYRAWRDDTGCEPEQAAKKAIAGEAPGQVA